MKRILMAMVVAVGIAVAIPLAPVQVEEAEARPDCQAAVVDRDGDGFVTSGDLSLAVNGPGNSGSVHTAFIVDEYGQAC